MSSSTTVKLVRGAHPQTPLPDLARDQSWMHRLAVVLDSYAPDRSEMYFDTALFLGFLDVLQRVIGASSVSITVERHRGRQSVLHSNQELAEFYTGIHEDDHDLPEKIIWFQNEKPIGAGFPERWYAVGGPVIYHDSFTLSVFTTQLVFPELRKEAAALCGERITGFHETDFLA